MSDSKTYPVSVLSELVPRAPEAKEMTDEEYYREAARIGGRLPRSNEARSRAIAWSKDGTENEPADGVFAARPETARKQTGDELVRIADVCRWLLSERFRCDQTKTTTRQAASEIAGWIADGAMLRELRLWSGEAKITRPEAITKEESMRAAGEKPDPAEATSCVAGKSSDDDEKVDRLKVCTGLADAGEKPSASVPGRESPSPVVWADEATPFTGPEVKSLLEENEKLRGLLTLANAKSDSCVVCGKLRDRRGRLVHWPTCKHPVVESLSSGTPRKEGST